MMKNTYEKPEIQMEAFEVDDVITASSASVPTDNNNLDEVGMQYETPGFGFVF